MPRSRVLASSSASKMDSTQVSVMGTLAATFPVPGVTTTWVSSNACSAWKNVTCSNGNPTYITSISLNLASLAFTPASLPATISVLSTLTSLQLTGGGVNGSLPQTMFFLTKLQVLDLTGNSITGPLSPLPFSSLTALSILSFNGNQLSGPIPTSLSYCVSLVYLLLGAGTSKQLPTNQLSGSIPNIFSKMSKLKALDLSGNLLTGSLPASLSTLPALYLLDLSNNLLAGPAPTQLTSAFIGTSDGTYRIFNNYFSGSPVPYFAAAKNAFCPALLLGGFSLTYLSSYGCAVLSTAASNCFLSSTDYWSAYNTAALAASKGKGNSGKPSSSPGSGGSGSSANWWAPGLTKYKKYPVGQGLLKKYQDGTLSGELQGPWGKGRKNGFKNKYGKDDGSTNATCYLEAQKPPALCAAFCNALDPRGPCAGQGSCYPTSTSSFNLSCSCTSPYLLTYFNSSSSQVQSSLPNISSLVPGFPSCTSTASLVFPPPAVVKTKPTGRYSLGLRSDAVAATSAGFSVSPSAAALSTTKVGAAAPKRTRRRSLLQSAPNGIPSRLNSYFRHLSLGFTGSYSSPSWAVTLSLDWRKPTPLSALGPVKDQGPCGSCWAVSAVSAMESALAIAGNRQAPPANISEQQVLDCQGTWNCSGGLPSDALNYFAYSSPGVTSDSNYPYSAGKGTCNWPPPAPYYTALMYEMSSSTGWFSILLAVQAQPGIADVAADQASFLTFPGGYVYNDPGCFANQVLTHSLLVVGYDLTAPVPFWILQNSWGTNWGEQGYMRLAIAGGLGICGINYSPVRYPVVQASNPCSPLNPCGGGTCVPDSTGSYACSSCPPNFQVATNIDGTQTCAPVRVCNLFSSNPCGVGTCIDDMAGSYNCLCPPPSYTAGVFTSGAPTCVPGPAPSTLAALPGMTCELIRLTFGLTRASFTSLNPSLSCTPLSPGAVVNVANPLYPGCQLLYSVNVDDSCTSIGNLFNVTLTDLNADLNCSALTVGQQVCVILGTPVAYACTQYYSASPGDTCSSIALTVANPPLAAFEFFSYNPGIVCSNLFPPALSNSTGIVTPSSSFGPQVCIQGVPLNVTSGLVGAVACKYGTYTTISGDTCTAVYTKKYCGKATLYQKYNLATCPTPLATGKVLCKPQMSGTTCL